MSIGMTARMMPLIPPSVNIVMKPSANIIGVDIAITTRSEVVKFAHTSSGMRQKVIPGARMVMIVTRKLSAVMIEDVPANWTPIVKNCWLSGAFDDSGA